MGSYLSLLAIVTLGIVLLWLGYSLITGQFAGISLRGEHGDGLKRGSKRGKAKQDQPWRPDPPVSGEPQVCPVCSSRLNKGDLVRSTAFPSITGGRDRLMHIRGCVYCLEGNQPRRCPVCGSTLDEDETLVARMFDRTQRRKHVHVLGCSRCRKTGRP